ncbi:CU044_5270 family protein [Actinomadura fibrosa]|uniref:CU044_5270 family protein n=1 Tax=Actinomadura fibrosa TaxID=111802 RepID=A0ABW2XRI2_9ACTN|nr:CU044_5270 family protein [Actinomadura fibrosa]
MDEVTMVSRLLTEERPASTETTQDARRRLTGYIAQQPRRRNHRRGLTLAAAATAAVAVAGGIAYPHWTQRPLYAPEPLAAHSGPAADFLLAAATTTDRTPQEGRLWFVSSTTGSTTLVESPTRPGVRYVLQVRQRRFNVAARTDNGLGKNHSATAGPVGDPQIRPVGPADRRAWNADGRPGVTDFRTPCPDTQTAPPPSPSSGEPLGYCPLGAQERGPSTGEGGELDFGIQDARTLPTDPAKLRAWLLNYATKFDHKRLRDPDAYLFTHASFLLIDSPVPDKVRAATYRVLAGLKGVRMVTTTDADGHRGRAVAMRTTSPAYGTLDWQLIIDGSTGRLTASQAIVERPGTANAGMPQGTRQFFEVIDKAEWTNAPYESLLPDWVNRLHRDAPEPG